MLTPRKVPMQRRSWQRDLWLLIWWIACSYLVSGTQSRIFFQIRRPAARNRPQMHVLERLRNTQSQVLHEADVLVLLSKIADNIAKKRNNPSDTSPTILSHFNHFFLFGNSLLEFLQKRKQIARKAKELRQSCKTIQ